MESMGEAAFCRALSDVLAACGMGDLYTSAAGEASYALTVRLLTENERYDLTNIRDERGVILRHFADSLFLSAALPRGARVLDVGCGAGFPSLPLAIFRPDLTVTAMDATEKRVRFVADSAAALGLSGFTALCARAEEAAHTPLRASFDAVTARAVTELRKLAELCLPYVRVGGVFLPMKAKNAAEELAAARGAIAALGGRVEDTQSGTLSDGEETLSRTLFCIRKERATPALYPRPWAKILKKPL